jgi:FG-GAP repeat
MSAMAGPTNGGTISDGALLPPGPGSTPLPRRPVALIATLALVALAAAGAFAVTRMSSTVVSSSPRRAPQSEFPRTVPVTLASSASASIGAADRGFWPVRRGASLITSGGGIEGNFTRSGASLGVPGGTLTLSLAGFGRGGHLQRVGAAAPSASRNQVLYNHASIGEQFRNGPYGLEQGFTVRRRPSPAAGPLVLSLALGGSLTAHQVGSQILFQTLAGAAALRYGQLGATDATGRALPARMQMRGGALELLIDDRDARYPIHIDPFVQDGSKLTGTGESGDGDFGSTVVLSGDGSTALIAGVANKSSEGAVWVFVRNGSSWTQQAKLTSGEGGVEDFGDSISLSAKGETAIVGADGISSFEGAAYVYSREGSTWKQKAKLTGKGEVGAGSFGSAVALSANGETAIVGGEDNEHTAGHELGAAWVFALEGGKWVEQAEFTDSEKTKEANFGSSVALSENGSYALIGGERDETSKGAAWVFTRSGSTWTQQGSKLTPGSEEIGAGAFGNKVALSAEGNTALIGDYHDNSDAGGAWVFTRTGSTWSKQANLEPTGETLKGESGSSVALSADGNKAIVGGDADSAGEGAAWVFTREGSTWTQQGSGITGKEETGEEGDRFGSGVSLSASGGIALIGGPLDGGAFDAGAGTGAAWVFVDPPEVITEGSSAIAQSGATLSGTVNPNGAEVTKCAFEYGTSEALGSSAACASAPGNGTTAAAVSASLSGLQPETTYHYRVTATNLAGTSQGQEQTFKTLPAFITPPSSVAFTITPDSDPLISLKTYTFAITNPEPGVTYQWDFGDKDSPLDSTTAPFVVEATGTSVTYAYPSPPVLDDAANGSLCPGSQCQSGSPFAVYLVRAQAVVPQGGTPVSATPQKVVVIPVQRPTAHFQVLRAQKNNEGTGTTTVVTKPVTIVPQAAVNEPDSNAGDRIVREDFWLNSQDSGPPDLTCLSDGVCGRYDGSAPLTPSTVPSPDELEAVPGLGNDGTGALTQFGTPAPSVLSEFDDFGGCNLVLHGGGGCSTYKEEYSSPTDGFESFSMDFWNSALAAIGSSASPIGTLPPEASNPKSPGFYERLPASAGYPPLTSVNLAQANGIDGEQGTGDTYLCESSYHLGTALFGGAEIGKDGLCVGSCFTGYPLGGGRDFPVAPECYSGGEPNREDCGDNLVCLAGQGTGFFPRDLAQLGPNSVQHHEDEWNFLYNYATVVGVDTSLDWPSGPATGERESILHKGLVPRSVTMVAYDAEGIASEPATQSVPLTPATNPTIDVCVEDVTAGSPCVQTGEKKPLPFPITEGDTMRFRTTGSNGGSDSIAYYGTAVGQPNYKEECESGGAPYFEPSTERPGGLHETHLPGGENPTEVYKPGPSPEHASLRGRTAISQSKPGGIVVNPVDELITGAKAIPFPIPVFSDLLDGAFPYHQCAAYAQRTVNANEPPPPLPKGGPNEPAHIASSHSPERVRARKASGGAIPAVQVTPSASAAANGLLFEFPREGKYSVSVAAYNTSGLGAITRIDGFEATKAVKGGPCESVNSIGLVIHDPNDHNDEQHLGFSGNCVSIVSSTSGHPLLYVSKTAVDIDGVPLHAQQGDAIVVRPIGREHNDEAEIYVAPCTFSAFETSASTANGYCPQKNLGTIYLAIGGGENQTPPGIGAQGGFSGSKARETFGALPGGTRMGPCGELPGSRPWSIAKESNGRAAGFQGFTVASEPCVEFTTGEESHLEFLDSLPEEFFRHGKAATSLVRMEGKDVPVVSLLETNSYANVARRRHSERVIDGSQSTVSVRHPRAKAHAAEIGFPPVPNCNPAKHNPNELEVPEGDEVGPIEMPVGVHFCYDKETGDYTGNVKVNIPAPAVFPLEGVEVGFEIGHGRLIDAGGEIKGNVPIGPVFLNELKFDIQTDPTVVAGAIEASIADVIGVEAATVVKPQTPEVAIEGTVILPIGGIRLGGFELVIEKNITKLRVDIDEQFGPAELELAVQGAMEFDPEFAFFMEGSGKACLWICLGAKGIVSNIGLAACGEINLLFVTLSAGVGVLWSGPNSGIHVFTGCDLSGYRPPSLRDVTFAHELAALRPGGSTHGSPPGLKGPPAAEPTPHATPQTVLEEGGHEQLTLNNGNLCTPKDETGCTKGAVAVQVHSLVSQAGTGNVPEVTLTGPAPEDPRVITTPGSPDEFSFTPAGTDLTPPGPADEGSALVDPDPVPGYDQVEGSSAYCAEGEKTTLTSLPGTCPKVVTTTMFIADPGKGEWTLSVDKGSPPVIDVSVAQPEPPVKASEFNPTVRPVTLSSSFHGLLAHLSATTQKLELPAATNNLDTLIDDHHLLLSPSVEIPPKTPQIRTDLEHPNAGDLDVPSIDMGLLRAVQLKVPGKWKGTVAIIDQGPSGEQVLASHISTSMIPSGGLPVLFKPVTSFGATHTIKAFLSNEEGIPSQVLTLSTYKAPALPTPGAPTIDKVVRLGSTVDVYFNPHGAFVKEGVGLALEAGNGMVIQGHVAFKRLHAIGRHRGLGAAGQAGEYMLSITHVDPTVSINIAIDDSVAGQLSATARRVLGPAIHPISELELLSREHTLPRAHRRR